MTMLMHDKEIAMEAMAEGEAKGKLNMIALYNWLKESGRDTDAEAMMKPENEDLRVSLYIEYNASENR